MSDHIVADRKNYNYLLNKLWSYITPKRKRHIFFLFLLIIIASFFEVFSIGAVLPFLAIIINPDSILDNHYISVLNQFFHLKNSKDIAFYITLFFILVTFFAGFLRILLLWASTKIAFKVGAEVSLDVYRRTLFQPYEIHIERNTSDVVSSVVNRVNGVIFWVIFPALSLVSSIIIVIAILATLTFINPILALSSIVIFGLGYIAVTFFSRIRLKQNSETISYQQANALKALQEGLGSIRDVLINNSQSFFLESYKKSDGLLRKAYGSNIFIAGYPRFLMEALGMILITISAYTLSAHYDVYADNILPTFGALALGAQRILPALQLSYSSFTSILGSYSSLLETIDLLEKPLINESITESMKYVDFSNEVVFESVSFKYQSSSKMSLRDISVKIPKGSVVGIVGSTGSGKSTFLDIFMGLLLPTKGKVRVDGSNLEKSTMACWQKHIAHVPQDIYLSDNTIAENIAFGIPINLIDSGKLSQSAKLACVSQFVQNKKELFNTIVGERGVRLSGGEKQRIGIARALYRDLDVLVLDEATSALDNKTERLVIDSILNSKNNLTILMVAHRLTTLKNCDFILEFKDGALVFNGSYEEIMMRNHEKI